jgi:hypothetical protein
VSPVSPERLSHLALFWVVVRVRLDDGVPQPLERAYHFPRDALDIGGGGWASRGATAGYGWRGLTTRRAGHLVVLLVAGDTERKSVTPVT